MCYRFITHLILGFGGIPNQLPLEPHRKIGSSFGNLLCIWTA